MAFALRLCFVAVVLVLLQEGESLKCYNCTSSPNSYCDDPFDTSKALVATCSEEQNACIHAAIVENERTEIRRACGDENDCNTGTKREAVTYPSLCVSCGGDLCNSVPGLIPSLAIEIAGLIFAKYYL